MIRVHSHLAFSKVHTRAYKVLALPLLHFDLQVFWVGELCFVIVCGLESCWQTFELILDCVEQNSGETVRLFPLIFCREFRVACAQSENHVCIRFAIVRLDQRFPENDLDDILQLFSLLQLNAGQGFHNCLQVVWANLVQQSTNSPAQLFQTTSGLCDSISILSLFEDISWIPPSWPSDFSVGC